MSEFSQRLSHISERIARAATQVKRDAKSVQLVAVSKTHPVDAVIEAIKAGQKIFGENRVQEAKSKFSSLRTTQSDLRLHLIGPLQTNKVEDAVALFDVIETLDRPKLAEALSKAIKKIGRNPELYIEINIGNEQQKAGIAPRDIKEFLSLCRDNHQLNVTGLMCIPPHGQNPETYFKDMKKLADQYSLKNISMGMSEDFETAIYCGATEVRIGTALFGPRTNSQD